MSLAARKAYQNTTVRLPVHVYERAKTVVRQSQASSFNEFVVQAIEEKVLRLTEAEIDTAFAQMAQDEDYQRSAVSLSSEFAKSDWEAFQPVTRSGRPTNNRSANKGPAHKLPPHEQSKIPTSKTRSR
jgi:hypothetical protein